MGVSPNTSQEPHASPNLGLALSQDLYQHLQQYYPLDFPELLVALTTPPKPFTIRVNANLIQLSDFIRRAHNEHLDVRAIPNIPDAVEVQYRTAPVLVPPKEGKHVTVDKYTAEAVLQGSNVFCPGVLQIPRLSKGDEVAIVSPRGDLVAYGNAACSSREITKAKQGIAIITTHPRYAIPPLSEHSLYQQGLFYNQSLPAILTSHCLLNTINPETRYHNTPEWILDLCAAPGGKTTHLVQLTRGRTPIIAIDRSINRIQRAQETMARLKIPSSIVSFSVENVLAIVKQHPEWQHRCPAILLDPPCTALGVRPKLYETKTVRDIEAAAIYQSNLLHDALELLAPKGILVYSTCTVSRLENELLLATVEPLTKNPPEVLSPHSLDALVEALTRLSPHDPFMLRFEPHIHGTTGYFIARLINDK